MRILAEVGQVLVALSFSAVIALWLGPWPYAAVASFVFVMTWLLMFDAVRREIQASTEAKSIGTLALVMAGTAIVFGSIWPALPPILTWSAWRRRGNAKTRESVSVRRRD